MLESILNLTPEQKRRIDEEVGPVRSVTEFCSSLLEGTKELRLTERLAKLLPWAAKGGQIVGEITPLAKVLVKLVDEIVKEKDPETLGLLACTLAYQRAAALALVQQGEPANRIPFAQALEKARESIKKLKVPASLQGFTLAAPLAHPLVWDADDELSLVVHGNGYSDVEWRRIQLRVHDKFRADLVEVLSHGESAARFEPFTRRLSLGDNTAAYAALHAHIERQRQVFEESPVLNIEPFALQDVYVDTGCGKLQWKDFPNPNDAKRAAYADKFDPFSEEFGGRQPLLETVLDYLGDPKFNDAVVIQGAPGCGKSSFTLRLASALRRAGLRPLRIRLKFLDLKKNLSEALAEVVLQPEENEDPALARLPHCSDPFLNDSIFQERTRFGDAEICPYVLILDGWDEITVAVNEGFEVEVHRMLRNVREQFLRPRAVKVRVVLTGRPSHAVERSQFLRDDTPILTVREYTADQLESYVNNVRNSIDETSAAAGAAIWPNAKWDKLKSVVDSYRRDPSKLDILGLPLLAHLSFRLLAQWPDGPEGLISDRATLYRHLLDLTCEKAGKASSDRDDLLGQARIRGPELRTLLQQTAVAITAFGNESIPFRELHLRLKKSRKQAMVDAESAGRDHPLTSLMISFYFRGGREHLGCEFLHKSFREYLYAEAIVELVKEYGRKQVTAPAKRAPYWKDFEDSDPRRRFSRELSLLLCPYPLTTEIWAHLASLLGWEIRKSCDKALPGNAARPQESLTFGQWEGIREGLTDLWDWWAEGVDLRPQPRRDESENLLYQPAFVNELLDYSLPRDRGPDALEWWPGRLVNADANVGDALCRLNAWVHACILESCGWDQLVSRPESLRRLPDDPLRPYQIRCQTDETVFVLFRPSGAAPEYFANYCARINSAGNRLRPFPSGLDLRYLEFGEVWLKGTSLSRANLYGANFAGAYLNGAHLFGANLAESNLAKADLSGANLEGSNLHGAKFGGANLTGAKALGANLHGADLSRADLSGAKFVRANFSNSDLTGAILTGGDFERANLFQATLTGANLVGANLDRANLIEAILHDAHLNDGNTRDAKLHGALGLTKQS